MPTLTPKQQIEINLNMLCNVIKDKRSTSDEIVSQLNTVLEIRKKAIWKKEAIS